MIVQTTKGKTRRWGEKDDCARSGTLGVGGLQGVAVKGAGREGGKGRAKVEEVGGLVGGVRVYECVSGRARRWMGRCAGG